VRGFVHGFWDLALFRDGIWPVTAGLLRADGGLDVDRDHLVELVAVKVWPVPCLAGADLVEPERGVGLVRSDDAAHGARFREAVHKVGEPQAEVEALDEQRPLACLADDRSVVDDGDINGDVLFEME
jgi:hypothetical protein